MLPVLIVQLGQPLRAVLLILFAVIKGGVFIIEQPGGSWLQYHPRIRWLARIIKVGAVIS